MAEGGMNWTVVGAIIAGVLGTNGYIASSNLSDIDATRNMAQESRDMTAREVETANAERGLLLFEITRLESELIQTRAKLAGVAPELKALADTLRQVTIAGCGEETTGGRND